MGCTSSREVFQPIPDSYNSVAIVMVGVGDGPWTIMREFDDQLPERRFDNFQFVNYNTIPRGNLNNPDGGFAMQALMEIPEQYNQIRDLGLIKN
ncbi:threonine--tRNA ligase 1 [Phytophthora nicotianae]|uniref:Threonine--tRNA ligase 1 n=1 Tax=Phytophthora nicotianae TaxID=4792 RepID=A0A0W8DPL6_PHYNI|nr:threonine--tRNA ligase 1 [Phytophthora nicotianae]